MTRWFAGPVALVVALLLVLAGCSFGGDDDSGPRLTPEPIPSPVEPDGVADPLEGFRTQELDWSECRRFYECATMVVPLSYDDPAGRTIEVALLRDPASDQEARLGSLVVNPGGPGGSGIDYAASGGSVWGRDLREVFDIVGFDPRGVGQSTPLTCVEDAELDALIAGDPDPDDRAELREARDRYRSFFEGCMETDAELARNVGTLEVARDLDVLRSVLGEGALTYFGASYGTFIGATYADLFPERVGRMVLDGAVDPAVSSVDAAVVQAEGFEVALEAYVGNCVEEGDCFLGDTIEEGVATIGDFLAGLDSDPLPVGQRELTQGLAFYGLIAPLYNRDFWSLLDQALEAGLRGQGVILVALADAYASRGPDGYISNAFTMLPVVNCSDNDEASTRRERREAERRVLDASPTFGSIFTGVPDTCQLWSYRSGRTKEALTAQGAAPILVTGTTRDPATPLAWAEGLAAQLDSGTLLIRDGDGHTAYNSDNDCIDEAIESYLVEGNLPEDGTRC